MSNDEIPQEAMDAAADSFDTLMAWMSKPTCAPQPLLAEALEALHKYAEEREAGELDASLYERQAQYIKHLETEIQYGVAERDDLRAERDRLRAALEEIQAFTGVAGIRGIEEIARAALAGEEEDV